MDNSSTDLSWYRSLFKRAIDGIFQAAPDGRLFIANPALAQIYGFASPEELRAVDDFDPYVVPGRRAEILKRVEQEGSVRGIESEVRRKDGAVIWISESIQAIRNDRGRIERFEGSVQDITARKLALEALRNRTQTIKLLQEIAVEANASESIEGTLQFALDRICGYTSWPVGHVSVLDEATGE